MVKHTKANIKKPHVIARNTTMNNNVKNHNTYLDGLKEAMAAGKRVSKNGNVYYERRVNRSDEDARTTKHAIKKKILPMSHYKKLLAELKASMTKKAYTRHVRRQISQHDWKGMRSAK